jgi:hypothetical protein
MYKIEMQNVALESIHLSTVGCKMVGGKVPQNSNVAGKGIIIVTVHCHPLGGVLGERQHERSTSKDKNK